MADGWRLLLIAVGHLEDTFSCSLQAGHHVPACAWESSDTAPPVSVNPIAFQGLWC